MNMAVWIAVFTAVFIVVFVPLYQQGTLARKKKENDTTKDA